MVLHRGQNYGYSRRSIFVGNSSEANENSLMKFIARVNAVLAMLEGARVALWWGEQGTFPWLRSASEVRHLVTGLLPLDYAKEM